jgi:hypothetical protein
MKAIFAHSSKTSLSALQVVLPAEIATMPDNARLSHRAIARNAAMHAAGQSDVRHGRQIEGTVRVTP